MNLFPYTMLYFLSELLRKLCQATHREWVWLFCTGEHSQHRSAVQLPRMGKVRSHFVFLCVQFIFHFVLLVNCAHLGDLQYWFGYVCNSKASASNSTCYCFSQEQNNHVLSQRCAAIHALQLHSKLEASSYLPLEWPILGPVQQMETWNNFFGPADLVPCIACAPTHGQKAFKFGL